MKLERAFTGARVPTRRLSAAFVTSGLLLAGAARATPPPVGGEPAVDASPRPEGVATAPPPGVVDGCALELRGGCGGATPSAEAERALRTPRPLPGLTLRFRAGAGNRPGVRAVAEATTDAAGRFSLKLPPGTSCVVPVPKRCGPAAAVPEPRRRPAVLPALAG